MWLITYISQRVAIWGTFCPPLYTVYNNSRSRKELCTRIYRWHVTGGTLPFFPSRFLTLCPPPPPCPCSSWSIARGVLRALPQLRNPLLLLVPTRARVSERARPVCLSLRRSCAGFLRYTMNHSACDCVRLITVIRLLLVPVYRPLIIIIDFPLVRHFLVSFAAPHVYARMRDRTRAYPCLSPVFPCVADRGKLCHSTSPHS